MNIFRDKIIDTHIPFAGKCVFCGFQDSRHRIFDVIMDSPDGVKEIADNYEYPVNVIERIKELRPYEAVK